MLNLAHLCLLERADCEGMEGLFRARRKVVSKFLLAKEEFTDAVECLTIGGVAKVSVLVCLGTREECERGGKKVKARLCESKRKLANGSVWLEKMKQSLANKMRVHKRKTTR